MTVSVELRSRSATENDRKWNFFADGVVKSICLEFMTMEFVIAMMINTFGVKKACTMIIAGLINAAHAIVYIWTGEMDGEERLN